MALDSTSFEPLWAKVDSLQKEGLGRSALEVVLQIKGIATSAGADQEIVKSVLHENKFRAAIEEETMQKALERIENDIRTAPPVAASVLHSILADIYKKYLEQHQYELNARIQSAGPPPDDIRLWNIEHFTDTIAFHYHASLEHPGIRNVAAADMTSILTRDSTADGQRPTLYDILAHRAIDYFSRDQAFLSEPVYKYVLTDPDAFGPASSFVRMDFPSEERDAALIKALELFQQVMDFHLDEPDKAALLDADLKRLRLVYDHIVHSMKTELYLEALERLSIEFDGTPMSAEVDYRRAELKYQLGAQYQADGDTTHRWAIAEALDIAQKAVDVWPDAYGSQFCKRLIDQIKRPSCEVQVEQVILPDEEILALISFQNTDRLYLKTIQITNEDIRAFNRMRREEIVSEINKIIPVAEAEYSLEQTGDYQMHKTEIGIKNPGKGMYLLVTSTSPAFNDRHVAYNQFHVSELAYFEMTAQGQSGNFFVTQRSSGMPLEEVNVNFYIQEYDPSSRSYRIEKVGQAISDRDGLFQIPDQQDFERRRNAYLLELIRGNDTLMLNEYFSRYAQNRFRQPQQTTKFFTDRAIYRPGQTVYFKGYLMRKDERGMPGIVPERTVNVRFLDVNRQEKGALTLTSNAYGTIQGAFQVPSSGLTGQMQLACDFGNTRHYFSVEEYKRPKFEVSIQDVEEQVKLGDRVEVTGKAENYAGTPVDGAEVRYRVERVRYLPFWRYGYARYWPGSQERMIITYGTSQTDEKGEFTVEFDALPEAARAGEDDLYYTFQIFADVVDISGETRSAEKSMRIGQKSFFVDVSLDEKSTVKALEDIAVHAQNLSGKDAEVRGSYTIEKLRMPSTAWRERFWEVPDLPSMDDEDYRSRFPAYAYPGLEKMENWPVERKIGSYDVDITGKDTLDLSSGGFDAGAYKFTFSFMNAGGEMMSLDRYVVIYDPKGDIPAMLSSIDWINTVQAEPGQVVSYMVGTGFRNGIHVFRYTDRQDKELDWSWESADPVHESLVKVLEEDRGGMLMGYTYIRDNRAFSTQRRINVPWSNKRLHISYGTFRDKLEPGDEEEWVLKISGPDMEKVAAEMLVSMYDASLDAFRPHLWGMSVWPAYSGNSYARAIGFGVSSQRSVIHPVPGSRVSTPPRVYRELNWFGYFPNRTFYYRSDILEAAPMIEEEAAIRSDAPAPPPPAPGEGRELNAQSKSAGMDNQVSEQQFVEEESTVPQPARVRTELDETAFFFPRLMTNENGEVLVKFTMKEVLTRWKFQGLAHTKDLKIGLTQKEVVTQKDLMVFPNAPRFFRQGDKVFFSAKINNVSGDTLSGHISLQVLDFFTRQVLNADFQIAGEQKPFTVAPGASSAYLWEVHVPMDRIQPVLYRIVADAGSFSDGEEDVIPVVSNRMLVTETIPLTIKANESKAFNFNRLELIDKSNTLESHKYALEFTSNPAWYAVQALPYLMEYPHECSEQVFSRLYANSLASHIANKYPAVRQVYQRWRDTGSDALLSNLQKNEELKSALLEETPWVLDALSEEAQKKQIGLLFDMNRMADEYAQAVSKLSNMQLANGGFPWFPGGRDNWYITQYIAEGFGHLDKLGVNDLNTRPETSQMTSRAIRYIDAQIIEVYNDLKRRVEKGEAKFEDDHLGNIICHYLYTRSFYPDIEKSGELSKITAYYLGQAKDYWLKKPLYTQGLLALALHHMGDPDTAQKILKSLRERSILTDETGRYWKSDAGYFWYEMPIERQSLMIELFSELTDDNDFVDELRLWLLRNKQTNRWETTKSTASAIYALLIHGDSWLEGEMVPDIRIGGEKVSFKEAEIEPGTGYVKKEWAGVEVSGLMAKIEIKNRNDHMAWGGVYWQYFEDMDKITFFEDTPVKLSRQFFVERESDRGPVSLPVKEAGRLAPGDKVIVRLILESDREMEFLHLKDMRASGFEPIDVISRYSWQGGLGYYQSTKDLATHFFIDHLPRGKFVIEYAVRIAHRGDFSSGISTLQCMYAPEFTAHTGGDRLIINDE